MASDSPAASHRTSRAFAPYSIAPCCQFEMVREQSNFTKQRSER